MKKINFIFLFLLRLAQRYLRRGSSFIRKSSSVDLPKYQHQILPHKNIQSYKKTNIFLIFILLLFIALSAVAIYPHIQKEDYVSEGIIGVYTLDNLPPIVTNLLSEPLVILDASGSAKPHLVEEWVVNDASTEYIFKLKDDLYWDDGTKVKSSDISFEMQDVEVSYLDDQTIVFKLVDSFAPFPTLLTDPVFKGNSLVGLGKFKLESMETNGSFITKLVLIPRNKKHLLPKVVIRFYPDEKTAKTAFELGEVMSLIGINENTSLSGQTIIEKDINNFNRIVGIFYNVSDPVLSDDNFRKVLTYASPKIEGEFPAVTSIPPHSWAYNPDIKDPLNNLEEAKKYLDKVQAGKDKIITLTTTPQLAKVGEMVVQNWKKLGINAVVRIESGVPQNFQALLISEPIPSDPDQYTLWHSTQTKTNLSRHPFAARIDKDLEDGRKISDIQKRVEKYRDFQKVLADVAPATFLYFPKTKIIMRKKAEANVEKIIPLQFTQFF